MDKIVSSIKVKLKKCKQRYHRSLFIWHLCTVGYNNTRIIAETLAGKEKIDYVKKLGERTMGYNHWLQICFASKLVQRGIKMSVEEEEGESPHHIPRRYKRKAAESFVTPQRLFESNHDFVPKVCIVVGEGEQQKSVFLPQRYCKGCLSKPGGYYGREDERKYKQRFLQSGKTIKRIFSGCNACQVILCRECFHNGWNH